MYPRTHKTAQAAWLTAQSNTAAYAAYIYGGSKPGIYDEGGQNVV
jgi:hypothetical protein